MSESIKAGDLVVLVKHNCQCGSRYIGTITSVLGIATFSAKCAICGTRTESVVHAHLERQGFHGWYVPSNWLKVIPPFPELADEKHDEEITA